MKPVGRASLGAVLPLVIMLLLTLLTLWLDRTVELAQPQRDRPITHDADYIVQKFSLTRLGEDGQPRYTLSSVKMVHYPDDDTSHLEFPRLIQASPGKPDTQVRADRGLVSSDGREVQLFDNVELFKQGDRTAGKHEEDVRITTQYLRAIPDEDRIVTPERVVIEHGNSRLSGIGMDYDNRYRNIRLQSAVRGTFEARRR